VYLTGYTPYPALPDDERLPHLADKISQQIHKTALDAEHQVAWQYQPAITPLLARLRAMGYVITALEQTPGAQSLPQYRPPDKLVIIVGREVEGIEAEVLAACDYHLEIPMLGQKESFNVVQAAAMVLYHCRYYV